MDAWWSLCGEGAALSLRRHGRDAEEVLTEYVANLGAAGGTPPRPVTVTFGGRELRGFAVELEVGDMHGGRPRRWARQVFAWRQAEGVAWLLDVQRESSSRDVVARVLAQPGFELTLHDGGGLRIVSGPMPPANAHPEVDSVLASWRWE